MSPVRTCVGCRATSTPTALLRVVVAHDRLEPDPKATRPGRGAWIHPDPSCVEAAARRRAWPRAFRRGGPLDDAAVRAYLAARV